MTEKLKPTPGPWVFSGEDAASWNIKAPQEWLMCGYPYEEHTPKKEDDWLLIAEAGTVHHECGLSPRELMEQNQALRNVLFHLNELRVYGALSPEADIWRDVEAALAKHKEV